MDSFFFNIKQSFLIIYRNRKLIYPSLLILVFVLNFSFYNIVNISNMFSSKSSSNFKPKNSQSNFLRFLNQISSDNKISQLDNTENDILSLNLLESVNSNITELALYYEFVQNITTHSYYGKWDNFNIEKNNFIDKNGEIELSLQRKKNDNFLFNLNQKNNNSNITVSFVIKDGEYIDNFIVANFSFNFKNVPLISNLNKDKFSIILPNISMSYASGHYMDISKKKNINNTYINMTFYKKPANFVNKMNHYASSTDYSIIDFHIKANPIQENKKNKNNNNNVNNFEIFFTGNAYGPQKYPIQILNYSIILTVAAFVEIYFCTKFLLIVSENAQMALNLDLYTIFMQIMWSALICGVNFFLSLTYEPLTYEYGMPSMIYFALFSIFLLRILFIGWKSRYLELLFADVAQFRKKLFRFYLVFYCLLFCTLISIKLWYTYFALTFFLFASTWIFQIYYSAKQGTKPPMPYSYIFVASLFKILIPIYLKAYENNIFSLRPSYFKVFLCVITVLIEAVIVSLQKLLGPKFFIPRNYRQQSFDYYKSSDEIPENAKSNECVICLENLENLGVNMEEDNDDLLIKENGNYIERLAMMIQKWNKKKNGKPYMKTPCGHIFHTRCLETWLEVKNECPYCRQKIPPLEI